MKAELNTADWAKDEDGTFDFLSGQEKYAVEAKANGYSHNLEIPNSDNVKFQALFFTGSRYTCDPPVTDTDLDIVALVNDQQTAVSSLLANGWTSKVPVDHEESYPRSKFTPLWLGHVNLILTESTKYYHDYVTATKLCKRLNILDKAKRINLFEAIILKNFLED